MEPLTNEFTVHRSIEQTWAVLTDVERIAPCMKGAQLQEIEGDIYRGVVKLKLGPISTQFKGQAHFVDRDDVNHRAVLKGEGRDTGGKGNAEALITAQLEVVSPEVTKVVVVSDIKLTGKVAQFGRLGVIRDTSEKLMSDFAHNLNTMLDADNIAPAAEPADAPTADAPAEPATAEPATTEPPATEAAAPAAAAEKPTVRTINGPAAEPIELSDLAGGSALVKRMLPAFGGLLLLLLVLRRLRK
ncbi:MAG: SRPBCC family protein [Actinomycetota bacterium]|nr:SRPBCC family protein [Actinomycetota bacterium]